MNKATNKLIRNVSVNFISQAAILLLSTLFTVYLARVLGAVNYGKYVFASTFPFIFFVSLDFLNDICVRDVAKDKMRASSYLSSIQFLKVILSAFLLLLICFLIKLMRYPADTAYAVYILSLFLFLQQLGTSFANIFTANEELSYPALSAVIEKAITVFLGLYILFKGGGLTDVVLAFILGGMARFIVLGFMVRKYTRPAFSINFPLWKYWFKNGYPILFGLLFMILLSRINVVFLSVMKGDEAVGIYGIGFGLYMVSSIIPISLMGAIFPILSRYGKEAHSSAVLLYKTSFKFMLAVAVLITIVVLSLAQEIIVVFFHKGYLESIIVLRLLFLALPLFFVRSLLAGLLLSINRQRHTMVGMGVALLFNIFLNFMLIPSLGYVGASISFVVAEIVIFSMLWHAVSKYFYRLEILSALSRMVIVGCVTFLFLHFFRKHNIFLISGLGLCLYVFLAMAVRLFSRKELLEFSSNIF